MSTRKELLIRLAHELAALSQEDGEKVAVHVNPKGTAGLWKLKGQPNPTVPAKPAPIPVNGQDIRKGYYESGDRIYTLSVAVKSDPATKGDKALLKAVEDLNKAHTAVYNALKPYAWD